MSSSWTLGIALKKVDKKGKLTLEKREEILIKVELEMLKGTQNSSFIAKKVGCSVPSAIEYQKAILKRWELTGRDGLELFSSMRAELIEKSRLVENELWEKYAKSSNESAALGTLRTLMELHKYQAWLSGISSLLEQKSK